MRGLCIGRRNWLFVGNDRGGRAAAIHFSLLASCKRHGHDPWVYYRNVLTRLPAILPAPARKNFSPSSPTAGIRLDLPVRQAYAQAAISPYVLGGTLTNYQPRAPTEIFTGGRPPSRSGPEVLGRKARLGSGAAPLIAVTGILLYRFSGFLVLQPVRPENRIPPEDAICSPTTANTKNGIIGAPKCLATNVVRLGPWQRVLLA